MESMNSTVAANLRRIRAERQLSLDRLAELTGVSKSMLGQIERGEASPTITTVWKIANGLKVSFSAFLEQDGPVNQLVDGAELTSLIEDSGKYTVLPFFCVDHQRNFEIYSVNIKPGGVLEAEPHFAGTQEYIIVYSGVLTMLVDGASTVVHAGQGFRFDAAVRHGYRNDGPDDVNCCMVLHYKN